MYSPEKLYLGFSRERPLGLLVVLTDDLGILRPPSNPRRKFVSTISAAVADGYAPLPGLSFGKANSSRVGQQGRQNLRCEQGLSRNADTCACIPRVYLGIVSNLCGQSRLFLGKTYNFSLLPRNLSPLASRTPTSPKYIEPCKDSDSQTQNFHVVQPSHVNWAGIGAQKSMLYRSMV